VQSAYNASLLSQAPYYQQEEQVFKFAAPRPVTPVYTQISGQLQTMISSVISGQQSAAAALSATAPTVKQLQSSAG
jgi:ABC-type glycerol-3-phosphate transport system substrate-binding protein